MGKKSDPPPPPDYVGAAEKTAESSNDAAMRTTWANRPTINTPWGTQSWQSSQAIDPATGKPVTSWTQNTTLTPDTQAALDQQQRLQNQRSNLAGSFMGRVEQDYSKPMDWSQLQGYGQMPTAQRVQGGQGITGSIQGAGQGLQNTVPGTAQGITGSIQGAGQGIQAGFGPAGRVQGQMGGSRDYLSGAEDALYRKQTSRLDPQWNQQQAAMETKLANMGITRGSSAYQREMDNFNRQRTDAYNQANLGSIISGGQEAQRLQGMDINAGQFGNQAQQQRFQQEMQRAGFGNQAQQQAFAQLLAGGQFGNQAQQQAYQQMLQSGQFGNQAQQQAFQQMLQGGQFGNAAQEQAFRQQLAASGQNFGQDMQSANYANQLRQQQIAEMAMQRGMSLNEMNALLTGQQVSMPQMPSFMGATGQQGVNYSGAVGQQYNAAMDAYNGAQAQGSAFGGGVGSLIGGVGGAMFGGPLGASIGSSIGGSVGKGLF